MFSAMVRMGTTFVEGPWRKRRVTRSIGRGRVRDFGGGGGLLRRRRV